MELFTANNQENTNVKWHSVQSYELESNVCISNHSIMLFDYWCVLIKSSWWCIYPMAAIKTCQSCSPIFVVALSSGNTWHYLMTCYVSFTATAVGLSAEQYCCCILISKPPPIACLDPVKSANELPFPWPRNVYKQHNQEYTSPSSPLHRQLSCS